MKKSQKEAILRILEYIIKLLRFPDLIVTQECCECLETIHNVVEDKAIQNYIEIILEEYKESNFIKESKIVALIRLVDNSQEQLEVFFLPYKASMWDAMESVYLHAIQDVRADVKIMPIPYISFDKETGSVHHHYEGDSFKHYDEYVHYDECDLEEERPDIIFIHNPYDDKNLVTRIDEKYFSSNLVKYTQHLVYIPYDVVVGDQIDRNYCLMPGVQNAWRVYVQSEKIRQEYIRCNRSDKVVALGSPKIDAVVNTTKSSVEIPEEWKVKIGDKKVILFNTHLAGILSEANRNIERILRVGEYFKEHPDWILLWRPHPLSIQTAEAMNPNFLQAYLALVEYMKDMPNVIYDDTIDMDRAIAISDAYIGDQSSLVMLYGFTGKPIYLHSGLKREYMEYDEVHCLDARINSKGLWVPDIQYNTLLWINPENMMVEEYNDIPCEEMNEEVLFGEIYAIDEKLLLIPCAAENFVWYDTTTKIFSSVFYEATKKQKFFCSIISDEFLFLFSLSAGSKNVKVDLRTKRIETIQIDYSAFMKEKNLPNGYIWGRKGTYVHNKCWLVLNQANGIISISNSGEINYCSVVAAETGFRQIAYDGENFWIIPQRGSEIICWNEKKGVIERFLDKNLNLYQGYAYEGIVCTEDAIWFLPSRVRYVLRICKKKRKIQKIPIPKEIEMIGEGEAVFYGYQLRDNLIYLFPYRIPGVVEINIESLDISYRRIIMKENMWKKRFRMKMGGSKSENINDCIYRDSIFSLDEFLAEVKLDTNEKRYNRKAAFGKMVLNDGSSGEKIWRSLMSEIWENN